VTVIQNVLVDPPLASVGVPARKVKVAILSNFPVDRRNFTGGVETATAALIEGLQAHTAEFDFHVVSASTAIARDRHETSDGVSFHFLGGLHRPWLRPRLPLRVLKAKRMLHRLQPDLVHCQDNPDLALAAILAGHQPILTVHGIAREEAHLRTGLAFWSTHTAALLTRLVTPCVRAYICNSLYVAGRVDQRRQQYAIPNAVGHTFLEAEAPRPSACTPPRLLFVGVLAPLKRPADLLQAHAILRARFPTLETVLCGPVEDEMYARYLRQCVVEQGLEGVHFPGTIDQPRLVQLLQSATVVVLPSAQENAPMAIAEAMVVGVPVVATRVGGVPEMIDHGRTGLLYEPGDIHGLVASIERLLDDTEFRRQVATNACQHARGRFTPAAVARETVAVYRRLLEQAPRA
jgi:glycosyltransferase involved in cell wall biosynthesis